MPAFTPTTLYKSPGPHPGPPVKGESTTVGFLDVNTEAELTEALADGWCKTLPKAVGLPDVLPIVSSKPLHELVYEGAYAGARSAGKSEDEAEAIAKSAADAADPPKKAPSKKAEIVASNPDASESTASHVAADLAKPKKV